MKAIIVSAHPDDAETAAGGFVARNAAAGHELVILHGGPAVRDMEYRGRRSWDVRIEEATAAAAVLGAQVAWLDWGHSEFEFNRQSARQLREFLASQSPDLVIAHWPVDTHPDHQVIGALTQHLFVLQDQWQLAFFEVYAGIQTLEFTPNRYVDISEVIEKKNKSILCHVSQNPEPQINVHDRMSQFRGLQYGVAHAESFHMMGRSAPCKADAFFSPPRPYKGG